MSTLVGVATGVAAGAAAQTASGIGLVLVCGPVLVVSLGPAEAVRTALVISLALNVALLAQDPASVRVRDAGRLAVPGVAVTVALGLLLRDAGGPKLAGAAGTTIVVATALLWRGHSWPWLTTRSGTLLAGASSGAMTVIAAAAGPVAALYSLNAGWSPRERTATLQAYFCVLNVVALGTLGPPHRVHLLLPAAAGLVAGVLLGRRVRVHLSPVALRRIVLALAGAGGAVVLVQSVV